MRLDRSIALEPGRNWLLVVLPQPDEAQLDVVSFPAKRFEHGQVALDTLDAVPRRWHYVPPGSLLFGDVEVAGNGIEEVDEELSVDLQMATRDFNHLCGDVLDREEL